MFSDVSWDQCLLLRKLLYLTLPCNIVRETFKIFAQLTASIVDYISDECDVPDLVDRASLDDQTGR